MKTQSKTEANRDTILRVIDIGSFRWLLYTDHVHILDIRFIFNNFKRAKLFLK